MVLYLFDHFNACHLRHLKLSNEQVYRARVLLFNRIRLNEVYCRYATSEELDLSLAAKIDQEKFRCLQVDQLVVKYHNHLGIWVTA